MRTKALITTLLYILIFLSCSKEKTVIDDGYPEIDMLGADAFPQNCDTLFRGESFTFRALFRDHIELGSYSIDVHHNFDQHTHSTEASNCSADTVKTAVNPFLFIQPYDIPEQLKEYQASVQISIPQDVDRGDYHLMIRLTDRSGWQTIRGIGVKIADRP